MSSTPEEYRPDADESPDTGTAYDHETGETLRTPHDAALEAEEAEQAEAANPNAASSAGLAGDMGISSERTGPADETSTQGLGDLTDFEGTGTVGSARTRTHGTMPTTGGPDLPDAPGRDPEADLAPDPDDRARPKRTVGESNTAEAPSHQLGNKNPGHSGA